MAKNHASQAPHVLRPRASRHKNTTTFPAGKAPRRDGTRSKSSNTQENARCKAYKYRLYPSTRQAETLQWTLDRTRELYNAALQERRDAYRMCQVSITYQQQAAQLPEIKELREEYREIHSQVLQDFLHKVSHHLVKTYQTIVFEKLAPERMSRRPKPKQDEATGKYLSNGASAKTGLNKSIRDAGWRQFVQHCQNKAEEAGSRVLLVDPRYTSQMCSGCGTIQAKTLEERWHTCSCGCSLDRDHNAALNILRIGLSGEPIRKKRSQARTEPSEDAPLRSLRL